jgi:DNA-binding MarR family transcriptional regulator
MNLSAHNALSVWHQSLATSVRLDAPDLSARQMALMLTVYLKEPPHTVRGLAQELNISKPAVVRALDALGRLDYVRRRRDEADRRNVLLQRTVKGSVYLSDFAEIVVNAAREL